MECKTIILYIEDFRGYRMVLPNTKKFTDHFFSDDFRAARAKCMEMFYEVLYNMNVNTNLNN